MLNQSFRQVFVTNSSALLASGSTVENLGVGQIGIVDAKTYLGVTSPTYANNKAIKIVQGTPDLSYLPLMSGVPNENEYSKLIKGKLIKGFRGKKAKRGRNQIITVGYSGDTADTNTIYAKAGEQKFFYLKLTGAAIDKKFSTQGVTRQYFVDGGCVDDCTDTCALVNPIPLAESIARQINTDPQINSFVKVSVVKTCTPSLASVSTVPCYRFEASICDTKDDVALGIVQAQYPSDKVTKLRQDGSQSVYSITKAANTAPTAISNAGFVMITDCPTCPTGYTLTSSGYVYTVKRADAGDAGALTQIGTDYALAASAESKARLSYSYGTSTYVVVSETALTVSGSDVLTSFGQSRNSCVITTPSTSSWTLAETTQKYPKKYRITVADSICGTNRLADLQAAFPLDTVALVSASSGTCVHTYETTHYSQCVPTGCSLDVLKWVAPTPFEGSSWVEVPDAALASGTTCLAGVKIEVAFVNRVTGECTFDYFPYEGDTIHLQASNFDPNYNNSPSACVNEWSVKEIQSFQYPAGFGAHVRKLEQQSKSYALRERSFDPVVREIEGYSFQAVADKYYDEYSLDFEFEYKVGGWSEKYVDSYTVSVFVPEGTGKNFENAINSYLTGVGVFLDPVVL